MGCGTIFKLTRDGGDNWTLTNLHYFGDGKRGASPNGNLIFDSIGNLYGTAQYGGVGVCQDGYQGCGAVFELIPSADGKWTYKILHEFENDGKDGFFPNGALVLDKAGNLYGSTPYGGSGQNCAPNGCGTVFELTPGADGKWTERIVHVFRNDGDGFVPFAGLTADRAGNLYGTTTSGGAQGGGTIFEITP